MARCHKDTRSGLARAGPLLYKRTSVWKKITPKANNPPVQVRYEDDASSFSKSPFFGGRFFGIEFDFGVTDKLSTLRLDQTLLLGALGLSLDATAEQLDITMKVVATHRRRLFKGLGVTGMAHAVGASLERGFFTNVRKDPGEDPESYHFLDFHPRSLQILRHYARGLGRSEVAATLFLSQETVKTYMQHTYKSLGVANAASAVLLAALDGQLQFRGLPASQFVASAEPVVTAGEFLPSLPPHTGELWRPSETLERP